MSDKARLETMRAQMQENARLLARYQAEYKQAEENIVDLEKQLGAMGFKPPFEDTVTAAQIALEQQEGIFVQAVAKLEQDVKDVYDAARGD